MRLPRMLLRAAGVALAAKVAGDLAVRRYEDEDVDAASPAGKIAIVDGQRLHYLDQGEGPAVVLLHGLGASTVNFRHTIPALAPAHRVIALDLAGHGLSTRTARDLSLAGQARLVLRLLDQLGIERFSLLGHSMGGSVAQRIALARPSRVERLILVASTTDAYMLRAPWASPLMAPFIPLFVTLAVNNRPVRRLRARLLVAHPERTAPEVRSATVAPSRMRGHAASYKRLMLDRRRDRPVDPSALTQPTLILWGDSDRLVDIEHGRRLARAIPDARLVVVPDAGHLAPEEQPETVNRALLAFLARAEEGAAGQVAG